MSLGLIRNCVLGAVIASSISVAAWAACVNCQACNCSYAAHGGILHDQCKCITCLTGSQSMPQTVTCCQTGQTCSTDQTRKQNYSIEFIHYTCTYGSVYSCIDITEQSAIGCCQ